MNKTDFIESIQKSADFPCEIDAEAVCSFLREKLPDDVKTEPEVFLQCMRISFEIFNYINKAEEQKHLECLIDSIGDAMDYSDPTDNKETSDITQEGIGKKATPSEINKATENIGLWQRLHTYTGAKKTWGTIGFISALILLSPIIMAIGALCIVFYAAPIVAATALMLAVLIPTVLLAVLAIIALSYGIAALFSSPPIGLMEIGLGTVLFSLAVALWAVNLGFFTFIIPFLSSKTTNFIKKGFSHPISFVFGKEVK